MRQAGTASDSVYVLFELQVQRYLDEMTTFANLPDNLTWVGLGCMGCLKGEGQAERCVCMLLGVGSSFAQHSPPMVGLCVRSTCFSDGMPPAPVSCMCRDAADVHYGFVFKVTAKDTFEGLQVASDLFVAGTLEK